MREMNWMLGLAALSTAAFVAPSYAGTQASAPLPVDTVQYGTVTVDGLTIAYREAGPRDAPTLLLLHGFPSSSRMFEPLFARLGKKYHMIAPDYPGFGNSDAPDRKAFDYSFDHISQVMEHFVDQVGLKHYTLYMNDYGGPVGFRIALWHPERVEGVIIQNTVAHEDGLGPSWAPRRAFWADRTPNEAAFRMSFLAPEVAKKRHIGSSPNAAAYNPDLWADENAFLARPGEADLQSDLFWSWQTNVKDFPAWQAFLKKCQPPTLVIWGHYDPSFAVVEADAYRRDVPAAEVHVIDAGHFAMDERPDEVATLIDNFVSSKIAK
jgi:pimeloyl-ACP methyl ester carboxylesterase